MRHRKLLLTLPVFAAAGLGAYLGQHTSATAANKAQDLKPSTSLPMSQVVLFNSGVGYFARAAEVEGDARVDLTFQESDINDLLKSMVLQDFGGGRVSAVNYDSREPIARTLSSFAINLNNNPTFAQILQQARGERAEVTLNATAANQPGVLSGTIVGLEKQKVPSGTNSTIDADVLNLWCADGVRAVKLSDIQRLRFANPVIESEFRRALDVLALNHDSAKKAVSLHFDGEGKRKVQVGYVVEAPVWKTSYRLVMDGAGKPYLQGWAVVENPTDEDWSNVKMALVSGRPISFKMDLYNPLFVPRSTVEPELFASLRPPTYRGGFNRNEAEGLAQNGAKFDGAGGGFAGGAGKGAMQPGMAPPAPASFKEAQARGLRMVGADKAVADERRKYAEQLGSDLSQRMNMGAVGSAATASALGDFFQYVIDHPVTLSRQKSALLPIVGKDVEGQRISIYNPNVQAKHPLLGLRFKNTTGMHLSQGPITVFEGSTYAGDTRVLDVQPNEERLVSYAIDLGTEIDSQNGPGSTRITSVKAVKGIVTTTTKIREEKKYRINNRSQTDRVVVLEHPNRTNGQFKLIDTQKPLEDTPEFYRFQTTVPAGKETAFLVNEERDLGTRIVLSNSGDDQIRYVLSLNEATPELKAQLKQALELKAGWDVQQRELRQVGVDLQRLTQDQDRIRRNLRETPKEAEVYAVYLKKLSDQEKEIDTLTANQKELMAKEFSAKKKYEDYLTSIND